MPRPHWARAAQFASALVQGPPVAVPEISSSDCTAIGNMRPRQLSKQVAGAPRNTSRRSPPGARAPGARAPGARTPGASDAKRNARRDARRDARRAGRRAGRGGGAGSAQGKAPVASAAMESCR